MKSLSTHTLPFHDDNNLQQSENAIIENLIRFTDLKIIISVNNCLPFCSHDKCSDFPFNANIFTHYSSCLHTSAFINILLIYAYKIRYVQKKIESKILNICVHKVETYTYPPNIVKSILHNIFVLCDAFHIYTTCIFF